MARGWRTTLVTFEDDLRHRKRVQSKFGSHAKHTKVRDNTRFCNGNKRSRTKTFAA